MLSYLLTLTAPRLISAVAAGLGLFAVLFILKRMLAALFDPLRQIPGPFLARFTHLWLAYQYYTNSWEQTNLDLHRKYGRVVRIGPNHYSFQDGEANKTIYGHGSHFTKWYWYKVWGQGKMPNLFNETNPHDHAGMRRKLTSAYTMSSLVSYEPFIDECNKILRQRLDEAAASGKTMDMQQVLQCYAFEVIGMLTFSRRLGFLDRCQDEMGFMTALHDSNQRLAIAGFAPSLVALLRSIWPVQAVGPFRFVISNVLRQIDSTLKNKSEAPSEVGPAPRDFTQKLIDVHKTEPAKLSVDDIVRAASQNIAAGSDTTGIALAAVAYYLIKNPDKLATLRQELTSARAQGKASDPITFSETQHLPYLQAVMKEAMRLHPSVGFTLPRVVPATGATLAGHYFPPGTTVGVNAWVTHRDEALWGPDASDFVPERWLDDHRHPGDAHFMTFGQGARTCLGKNISMLELSKLVPELVLHYDFQLAPQRAAGPRTESRWFAKFKDFDCVVFRRKETA